MKIMLPRCILFSIGILLLRQQLLTNCVPNERIKRATLASVVDSSGAQQRHGSVRSVSAPLLDEHIDLDSIEGVEQVTRLVLLKTDSQPGDSEERIDGRYLNSLMETLYTGLRKPFKSVSADILGIFPSFEEVQVRCQWRSPVAPVLVSGGGGGGANEQELERDQSLASQLEPSNSGQLLASNETRSSLSESLDLSAGSGGHKSSMQVCKAVTNDCLSMDDLVSILPPSVASFDAALVRLCPVVLFRIMNHLCEKAAAVAHESLRSNSELAPTTEQAADSSFLPDSNGGEPTLVASGAGHLATATNNYNNNTTISLNALQILKNLHLSDDQAKNRPQKLHKKLKRPAGSKNGRLANSNGQQRKGVDEQLLKIKLKLSEPSIEKVWIFSLLFVVLSIVVSMGGLIVLPFVKKTTRRRILTLFEGLAVGGLTGSATLHMFPQAFGLVDEIYHKYFWRIFVVFFGIYLCYLCERIIKIFKVVRARRRRRSRASLSGAASFGLLRRGELFRRPRFAPVCNFFAELRQFCDFFRPDIRLDDDDNEAADANVSREPADALDSQDQGALEWTERLSELRQEQQQKQKLGALGARSQTTLRGGRPRYSVAFSVDEEEDDDDDDDDAQGLPSVYRLAVCNTNNPTRQRLLKCLKSVQCQFSPVYAVYSSNSENRLPESAHKNVAAGARARARHHNKALRLNERASVQAPDAPEPELSFWKRNPLFERWQAHAKASKQRREMKQREIETMLYHKHRMEQQLRIQQLLEERERRAARRNQRRQQRAAAAASGAQHSSEARSIAQRDSGAATRAAAAERNPSVARAAALGPASGCALQPEPSAAVVVEVAQRDTKNNSASAQSNSTGAPLEAAGVGGAGTPQAQSNNNAANNKVKPSYMQRLTNVTDVAGERQDQDNAARVSVDTVAWMIVFGDAVLNVIDGLSIGAAFERNILAGISISVAVMLEEVTHRLGTFAVLIRAGMSMQQSLLCTFLSACALFPGLIVGILLSDATEDATPYIFCAAGGIFLYMALVDVMKEMNRSIENAIRKDIKSTLQIFALQNVGIIVAVIFLSFLALYEQAMDFEEYQMQYNQQ